jgi:Flp pilus assembly protein TadD
MDSNLQNQVDALNGQALAMARSGHSQMAEKLWFQALLLDPEALPIRTNLARLYFQGGRFQEVLDLCQNLAPNFPYPPALAALVGQSALRLGQAAMALRWLSVADRLRPNEPSLQLSLSEAMLASGHVEKAVAILELLVQQYPNAVEPQLNLALAKAESGSIRTADVLYSNLLARWPDHPAVLMNAARFQLDYGDRDQARRIVDDLLRLDPYSRIARLLFADLCRLDGDVEQSRSIWQSLLNEQPLDLEVHLPLIFTSMDCGDWSDAAVRLQQAFALCQGAVPSRLLAAWADLPASHRVSAFPEWQLDYSSLVQKQQLLSANDPLLMQWIAWLKADSSLIENRPGKPTIGGMQSHELLNRLDDHLSQNLLSYLRPAVEAYCQHYRNRFPLNLNSSQPSLDRYSGWAVVLRPGGQQLRHTHPEATISGVLYLSTPQTLASDGSNEGSLWFSPNPLWHEEELGCIVHPRPGLLVLFPSFLPHETIPFVSKGDRTCVAFNVI